MDLDEALPALLAETKAIRCSILCTMRGDKPVWTLGVAGGHFPVTPKSYDSFAEAVLAYEESVTAYRASPEAEAVRKADAARAEEARVAAEARAEKAERARVEADKVKAERDRAVKKHAEDAAERRRQRDEARAAAAAVSAGGKPAE